MNTLTAAYHPEKFQKLGKELIDLLTTHLQNTLHDKNKQTIPWNKPSDELNFWKEYLKNGAPNALFKNVIAHSIHLHNPKYMGHQICPPLPITALTAMLSALLNNGMAVYEMGIASSSIENIIIETLTNTLGYDSNAGGFLTSGGTLANLTALLSARKAKAKGDVWNEGSTNRLAILVSEEAHYCVDRAAKIMGLGAQGILKVPVKSNYQIDLTALNDTYQKAIDDGLEVIALIGSAPTTSTGIYDDLSELAIFCQQHELWFHVDGAHGGAAIFSSKYKHTVNGIEQADSVVIDGHKMLMTPALTTALLYKNKADAQLTFNQKAAYLLETSEDEDWYNLAKQTFECTKSMMSIHWYAILKLYGVGLFDNFVTTLYDLGKEFSSIIATTSHFEVALEPMSNIVCFRYKKTEWSEEITNKINTKIRQIVIEKGLFYIVQTKLKETSYLRVTLMNPFTNTTHLRDLLSHIKAIADTFEASN
jgi:L-2,4-diaminobutyrate decarboxylase